MATVLITGASGMLGLACSAALLAKKHTVIGVDGITNQLANSNTPNYTFVPCDITDKDVISGIVGTVDTVVHLANTVDNDLDSYITDNEMKKSKATDKYIYDAAAESRCKNFILASTTQVYGIQKGREPIRETTSEKGSSNYCEMKLTSEKYLMKAFKKADCVPVIARIAPIYTSEYTQNLRDKIYDSHDDVAFIYNDGSYGFSFCCLYNLVDFVKGIVAIPSGRYDGLYNVSDSDIITAKQIADYERDHHRISEVVQRNPGLGAFVNKAKMRTDYRYFDPSTSFMNWRIDNTKAKRIAPMKWNLSNTK